jgi:transcriptional regulator GlxA family with amidase domain
MPPYRRDPRKNRSALRWTRAAGAKLQATLHRTRRAETVIAVDSVSVLCLGVLEGEVAACTGCRDPLVIGKDTLLVVHSAVPVRVAIPNASNAAPASWISLKVSRAHLRDILDETGAEKDESSGIQTPLRGASGAQPAFQQIAHRSDVAQELDRLAALLRNSHAHRNALVDLCGRSLIVRLLASEARVLLLRAARASSGTHGLGAALHYVDRHLGQTIAVEDLAAAACRSRATFYRRFRRELGMTPLQYITQLRMDRAQKLLQDPTRSVTGVSYDLGYSSVSHFIALFKRHAGMTPKTYQQSQQDVQKTRTSPDTAPEREAVAEGQEDEG